jgi:hypothetical protein
MDAPVGLIVLALLAACGLVLERPRAKAWALLATLGLLPVVLVAHIWDTGQVEGLRDRPVLLAAAGLLAGAAIAALALLVHRRPAAFPLLAVAALPFRVPIAIGGSTANLLVPLYLVVAGGAVAYAYGRLRPVRGLDDEPSAQPDPATRGLEWALAVAVVLYAVQATSSADPGKAADNGVFFYVPFALLFVLLRRVTWTPRLVGACGAVLAGLALALAGVGFVEYASRHLLLNPKVIASNQLGDAFRVNSLFFDPNMYGRFLVLVMVALATGLLAGLTAIAGGALIAAAPGALNLHLRSAGAADRATSGRWELIRGGAQLFAERPLAGHGSGSFAREFRRSEHVSAQRATSASHTTPLTVAAEQGAAGLAAYAALLWFALRRLLGRAREVPERAAAAACFAALLAHTLMYAAFLEDPLTWTLLGAGSAFAFAANRRRRRPAAPVPAERVATPA